MINEQLNSSTDPRHTHCLSLFIRTVLKESKNKMAYSKKKIEFFSEVQKKIWGHRLKCVCV
jgi:hypothetical protein